MNGRLLMLNYEFPPIGGGAGNAHLSLLKEYASTADLRVDVLTSGPKPGFSVEQFSHNVTIYKVGLHKKNLHFWRRREVIEWLLRAKRPYRRLLRENGYDLVHAFFGFPTAYLCYRTANDLPYMISLRGSDVPGYNVRLGLDYKLTAGLFRKIWSGASMLVANSAGLRKLARKFMPNIEIEIIPNGIDTERFHPAKEQGVKEPIQLLTVGRLITRKRIDLLIRAVDCAGRLGLNVQLNIAGDGNLLAELRTLAEELAVADRVTFLQRVPPEEIAAVYRRNSIFVMCSAHEGMSNAMLEAMASGLPIVTTPCEGVDELIGDNGIVVETAAPPKIAEAIRKLATDEQRRRTMSQAAREKAKDFAWPSVADQYIRCYKNVLGGPTRAPGKKHSCAE
ncbi:MAG: glycosyltransferase family 4 protein [Candidatus Zixiibacteriota bacterium]|nr:MAG: glycosyltransferase family 4 protein [candidate division Zixibacteria bacterium]